MELMTECRQDPWYPLRHRTLRVGKSDAPKFIMHTRAIMPLLVGPSNMCDLASITLVSVQCSPLDPSVLRVNDLPGAKVFNLTISWWEHANHSARAPVDEPLLPFADDII